MNVRRTRPRPGVVLDGEIVVYRAGRLDFGAVQQRAASGQVRAYALAREAPASFVAIDLVRLLAEVSAEPSIQPIPMTTDPDEARVGACRKLRRRRSRASASGRAQRKATVLGTLGL
ncbi:hypothetical protein ACFYXM_10600 [Streptomyces sp. NPDC002476]|uniref:hypothetical protein n=1 Tax=Streptomyces sp. NPDC002476 TaxID=3364648 RepID=UPI0036AE50D0